MNHAKPRLKIAAKVRMFFFKQSDEKGGNYFRFNDSARGSKIIKKVVAKYKKHAKSSSNSIDIQSYNHNRLFRVVPSRQTGFVRKGRLLVHHSLYYLPSNLRLFLITSLPC